MLRGCGDVQQDLYNKDTSKKRGGEGKKLARESTRFLLFSAAAGIYVGYNIYWQCHLCLARGCDPSGVLRTPRPTDTLPSTIYISRFFLFHFLIPFHFFSCTGGRELYEREVGPRVPRKSGMVLEERARHGSPLKLERPHRPR